MPTALDIAAKVRLAYPDAMTFWDNKVEKVFFCHNGLRFLLHPMPSGVKVVIRKGERQVFSGIFASHRLDMDKLARNLQVLAHAIHMIGRKEEQ